LGLAFVLIAVFLRTQIVELFPGEVLLVHRNIAKCCRTTDLKLLVRDSFAVDGAESLSILWWWVIMAVVESRWGDGTEEHGNDRQLVCAHIKTLPLPRKKLMPIRR